MKGRQLLSAVTWNERGEVIHKGVAIRGSNAVDLVHDLLRNRKTPDPVGWQQFANQMRAPTYPWNWSATSKETILAEETR